MSPGYFIYVHGITHGGTDKIDSGGVGARREEREREQHEIEDVAGSTRSWLPTRGTQLSTRSRLISYLWILDDH